MSVVHIENWEHIDVYCTCIDILFITVLFDTMK